MGGVQVGWGGGGSREMGRRVFSQWGRWRKTSVQTFSNLFLFQYFKTLTENAYLSFGGGSHLGIPCRGALLGPVEREEGKTSSDQYPVDP